MSEHTVYIYHVDANVIAWPTGSVSTHQTRTGTAMAVASMSLVQIGMAAAIGIAHDIGAEGAGWMRLMWAGLIMLLIVRPRRSSFTRSSLLAAAVLGVVTAAVTLLFMAAAVRLPLGTASALEFLGPLGVAAARSHSRRALVWPGLAAVGVVLLTEPWHGPVEVVGVLCALGAACCWAAYILLTQHVGDTVTGLNGLAVSLPVAGLVATVFIAPSTIGAMTWQLWIAGIGLGIMLPLVPFTLELLALRRLTTAAFGTLMCLEPALALIVGFTLLDQTPGLFPVLGLGFVVAAGVGAERSGARHHEDEDEHVEAARIPVGAAA